MKIIFMGTPDFAVPALKALTESQHEIVAVYTQKPKAAGRGLQIKESAIHKIARIFHVDVFTPDSLKSDEEIERFRAIKADIAVVVAYGMILPEDILHSKRYGCINIHPSRLPRWRGAAPLQRTLMSGDDVSAVCIMKMDEGLDTGTIITGKEFNIPPQANAEWLHNHCAELGAELLLEALDLIATHQAQYKPQDELGVSYAKKITKQDAAIDNNAKGTDIINQIRGLSPFMGAGFTHDGTGYKLFEAEFIEAEKFATMTDEAKKGFYIKCADGVIAPKIIQKEGKTRMDINEFLKGNKKLCGTLAG